MLEQIEGECAGAYVDSRNLLNRLKNSAPRDFAGMDLTAFICDFLNVMQGIERLGDRESGQQDAVRLSDDGREILALARRSLFRALVQREQLDESEVAKVIDGLTIRRLN